jgi:hypothetical protein
VLEARRTFPEKEILMGETGNCHFAHCYLVTQWLALLDEQLGEANRQGADLQVVTWAPILTLGDFDWGKPAPGAWATWDPEDSQRRRQWDPAVARLVREYATPAATGGEGTSRIV